MPRDRFRSQGIAARAWDGTVRPLKQTQQYIPVLGGEDSLRG